MCRWRQIEDEYTHCNHVYRLPDEMVYCPERDCKFSPNHPPDCVPPKCTKSCWQYRRFPEQIGRRFERLCPNCQHLYDTQQAQQGGQQQ